VCWEDRGVPHCGSPWSNNVCKLGHLQPTPRRRGSSI